MAPVCRTSTSTASGSSAASAGSTASAATPSSPPTRADDATHARCAAPGTREAVAALLHGIAAALDEEAGEALARDDQLTFEVLVYLISDVLAAEDNVEHMRGPA